MRAVEAGVVLLGDRAYRFTSEQRLVPPRYYGQTKWYLSSSDGLAPAGSVGGARWRLTDCW